MGTSAFISPVEVGAVAGVLRGIVFPVRFDGTVCAISP